LTGEEVKNCKVRLWRFASSEWQKGMKNDLVQTSQLRSTACKLKRIVASRTEWDRREVASRTEWDRREVASRTEWDRREFHKKFGAEKLKIKGTLGRYVIR